MEIINAKDLGMQYSRENIVDMFCESLMSRIIQAKDNGKRKCCFDAFVKKNKTTGEILPFIYGDSEHNKGCEWFNIGYSFDDYKEDVKRIFQNHGYIIKPTGYIGGVWQTTEDICW